MILGIGITALLVCIAVIYWLFITTEGTYLGARVVALLYDWSARRYDDIKKVHLVDEALFIGVPLQQTLAGKLAPRVLDIATGTGRVPIALLGRWRFDGIVVGLDRSRRMLRQASEAMGDRRTQVTYMTCDAEQLCWDDASFDCVTCLEALEFVPSGRQAVSEMWRVLKPGGTLLVSNRVGPEARFFPGRISRRGVLEAHLASVGFEGIDSRRWQVHYDLVWARKPGLD
jgi:ubiquinone/menaquinone biosynthesis C-methylase UbiE